MKSEEFKEMNKSENILKVLHDRDKSKRRIIEYRQKYIRRLFMKSRREIWSLILL